jgi:hypothetical protein
MIKNYITISITIVPIVLTIEPAISQYYKISTAITQLLLNQAKYQQLKYNTNSYNLEQFPKRTNDCPKKSNILFKKSLKTSLFWPFIPFGTEATNKSHQTASVLFQLSPGIMHLLKYFLEAFPRSLSRTASPTFSLWSYS